MFSIAGREEEKLSYITKYLQAVNMFRDYDDVSQDPDFSQARTDTRQYVRIV